MVDANIRDSIRDAAPNTSFLVRSVFVIQSIAHSPYPSTFHYSSFHDLFEICRTFDWPAHAAPEEDCMFIYLFSCMTKALTSMGLFNKHETLTP